jgi:hypothetical protein
MSEIGSLEEEVITIFEVIHRKLGDFFGLWYLLRLGCEVGTELSMNDLKYGDYFSFEASNFRHHFMRHQNYEVKMGKWEDNDLYWADAAFRVVAANNGQGQPYFSLESRNYPGHFIRHQNYNAFIHRKDGSDLYNADSTFKMVRRGDGYMLESANYPGHFLRHQNFRVKISKNDGSGLFYADATWIPLNNSHFQSRV